MLQEAELFGALLALVDLTDEDCQQAAPTRTIEKSCSTRSPSAAFEAIRIARRVTRKTIPVLYNSVS